MIRFALKTAFGLGLLALVLPLGQGASDGNGRIDMLGVLAGAQEAMSDLGNFCERAPRACSAGREVAAFAGERIEAGARIAYGYLSDAATSPAETSAPTFAAAGDDARPDPVTTGAVGDMPPPRPYLPPKPASERPVATSTRSVAVPTPAPRT